MSRSAHRIGNKPRGGDAAAACAAAWAQAGGVRAVERETGIKAKRLYEAADPDAADRQKPLTWDEVLRIERDLGVTAFSDALVALHGAVALHGDDSRDAGKLAPRFAKAAGDAVAALLDGRGDAVAALDLVLKTGAALRATLSKGAAP